MTRVVDSEQLLFPLSVLQLVEVDGLRHCYVASLLSLWHCCRWTCLSRQNHGILQCEGGPFDCLCPLPHKFRHLQFFFFFFYCYWNTLSLEAFHMRICSFLWGGGVNTGCMTMILLIPLGNNLTSEFHILLKHIIWRWFCSWVFISITLCIIIFITPTSVFSFLTITHNSVCPPSASTLSLLCSSQIIDTTQGKIFF